MVTKIKQKPGSEKILCPMTDVEAAAFMGLSVQTLRNWRHIRKGPAYRKLERRVVYLQKDLQAYLDKSRIDPEARPEA